MASEQSFVQFYNFIERKPIQLHLKESLCFILLLKKKTTWQFSMGPMSNGTQCEFGICVKHRSPHSQFL